jgi:hypothetical protein
MLDQKPTLHDATKGAKMPVPSPGFARFQMRLSRLIYDPATADMQNTPHADGQWALGKFQVVAVVTEAITMRR